MKNLFFTLFLFGFVFFANAQTSTYQTIKKLISETHPEINLEDKLIAFNTWSIHNEESREANKSFEKAYKVYEHALLKGGSKGIVILSFNKDNQSPEAVITFAKDGIVKLIPFNFTDIEGLDVNITNAVFDSNGNKVYTNLSASIIYNSINRLITR